MIRLISTKVGLPGQAFTHIISIESSSMILGSTLAERFRVPFIPCQKHGRIPGLTYEVTEITPEEQRENYQI